MSVVINVGGRAQVSRVGERLKGSGSSGAGNSAGVHLAKDHASGFDQTERGVDGEEFAGGAGFEQVGIVHAIPICTPIQGITGQLGELISAVCCGRERFLELVVRHPVIPAHPDPALSYINILGGVGWGFSDEVWARGGGRFGKGV